MEKLQNLNQSDLIEINGGSELTDAIWFGIGYAYGKLSKFTEGMVKSAGTRPPNAPMPGAGK
jgi:hypothetical protein